jgi:general secretion pathway protein I
MRASGRRGFTLIEVLVTMLMIAIILPVAMRGISHALFAAGNAKQSVEATTLAENKLAEITSSTQVAANGGSGDFSPDFPQYKWQSNIVSQQLGMFEVDVTVSWDSRGQQRSVQLSTWVYQATQ